MKKRNPVKVILIFVIVVFVVAQFVQVARDNPPVRADFNGDVGVRVVLKKSCYDCHSNETVWPWYSYVAPMSWLVASDVEEARQKLNFSDWGLMQASEQAHAAREVWGEVREGAMPLAVYLLMHSDAKLTDADKAVIQAWAEGGAAGGTTQPSEATQPSEVEEES